MVSSAGPIRRGDICWADLGEPRGSGPGKRRPLVIVQADPYNRSRLATTLGVVITSNTALAAAPGNVFLPGAACGLAKDSVANVTALVCLDREDVEPPVGHLPSDLLEALDTGLRRVLGLR